MPFNSGLSSLCSYCLSHRNGTSRTLSVSQAYWHNTSRLWPCRFLFPASGRLFCPFSTFRSSLPCLPCLIPVFHTFVFPLLIRMRMTPPLSQKEAQLTVSLFSYSLCSSLCRLLRGRLRRLLGGRLSGLLRHRLILRPFRLFQYLLC